MKAVLFFLFVLFLLVSCQDEETCPGLGVVATINSCSAPFPSPSSNGVIVLPANTSYECELSLSFNFTGVDFYIIGMSINSAMQNQWTVLGDYWSLSSLSFLLSENDGISNSKVIIAANLTIPPNSFGVYSSFWSSISILSKRCYIFASFSPSPQFSSRIFVDNSLQIADITPPLVYALKTDKDKYKKGEKIYIQAYIVDHSNIYLEDAFSNFLTNDSESFISCYAQWTKMQEKETMNKNQQNNNQMTQGWFVAECEIDKNTESGKYHLEYVSIMDIYGNMIQGSQFWKDTVTFHLE